MNSDFSDLSNLPRAIHQASLNPHQDPNSFYEACEMSKQLNFGGICVALTQIPLAREKLGMNSKTKLIAGISFPFGTDPDFLKKKQAEWATLKGAEELDVVPNFFALNQGKTNFFAEELATICEIGLPVRVILNLQNLDVEKIPIAIDAAIDAGVSGVQNGNGFGKAVTKSDIIHIKKITKGRCHIKAVGGIRTVPHALELLQSGANIIGTSCGKEIIQDLQKVNQ